jgi:hypothetical protein
MIIRQWKLLGEKNVIFLEYRVVNKLKISCNGPRVFNMEIGKENLEFNTGLISSIVIVFCLQNDIPYFASSIS